MNILLYCLHLLSSLIILLVYGFYLVTASDVDPDYEIIHWLTISGTLLVVSIGSYLSIEFKRSGLYFCALFQIIALTWPFALFISELSYISTFLVVFGLLTFSLNILSIFKYEEYQTEISKLPRLWKYVLIGLPNITVLFALYLFVNK